VLYQGATPVLCDVDAGTLLLSPEIVERRLGPRTRAVIAVDFAGQPCDWDGLRAVAAARGVPLVADACHALGASDRGRPVGTLADLTVFSLHPVKHVTAGEGGVITCADRARVDRMRTFRHHGITRPPGAAPWNYEVTSLGQNYRLTDVQCALARQQLTKLEGWIARRREIAARYDAELTKVPGVQPLIRRDGVGHAYHLYVVRLAASQWRVPRDQALAALRAEGILATLHYPPVHLHPFYRTRLGTAPGDCPDAEAAGQEILSLPMFPLMSEADQDDVFTALHKVARAYGR
jgi:perosamine synthetase